MGIAEIQAALAANKPAANPFTAPAAPAPAPSPFGAPHTAAPNPFGGSAPAPAFQPPPAFTPPTAPAQPVQAAFAFNPPPGFDPASTPPINPPGERASLNSVAAEAPAAPVAPAPPAEPKRRGRKPKAETLLEAVAESPSVPMHRQADAEQALASPAEIVLSSISTEDLVALLRDRGYTVILESKS